MWSNLHLSNNTKVLWSFKYYFESTSFPVGRLFQNNMWCLFYGRCSAKCSFTGACFSIDEYLLSSWGHLEWLPTGGVATVPIGLHFINHLCKVDWWAFKAFETISNPVHLMCGHSSQKHILLLQRTLKKIGQFLIKLAQGHTSELFFLSRLQLGAFLDMKESALLF